MPGPEDAQQQHAERIRELTQNRREEQASSPEENMMRMVQGVVDKAVKAEVGKLRFAVSNGIRITGSWPTFTISQDPITLTGTITCNEGGDGATFNGTAT